jgi:lipoyl(octanoyl) transferase
VTPAASAAGAERLPAPAQPPTPAVRVRALGRLPYGQVHAAMQDRLRERAAAPDETPDEIWWLEHEPVYTLGLQGARGHVHDPGTTPVVQSDRGGHVTWHGPGQLVVYVLLDLRRRGLDVRGLVRALEQAVIDALGAAGVQAGRRAGAPGVYVGEAKIAALGLRVQAGLSRHGLALNVENSLEPFGRIDPCGMPGLAVTRTRDLGLPGGVADWALRLVPALLAVLPEAGPRAAVRRRP